MELFRLGFCGFFAVFLFAQNAAGSEQTKYLYASIGPFFSMYPSSVENNLNTIPNAKLPFSVSVGSLWNTTIFTKVQTGLDLRAAFYFKVGSSVQAHVYLISWTNNWYLEKAADHGFYINLCLGIGGASIVFPDGSQSTGGSWASFAFQAGPGYQFKNSPIFILSEYFVTFLANGPFQGVAINIGSRFPSFY